MSNNYKLSGSAYPNSFRENYNPTHEQIHVIKKAVEINYKNGGGSELFVSPKQKI
jgi:hypothetical protein